MNKKVIHYILAFFSTLIVGYSLFIYAISSDFTYAARPSKEDLVLYIIIRIIIGIVYTLAVFLLIRKQLSGKKILIFIFSVGFLSRIILVQTDPILEDDFNRYLWDGAVTANGYNAFEYPPKQFLANDSLYNTSLNELNRLAEESGDIIHKINHPHIRTIYPPVAQAAFALSYLVKPWSVQIWKGILLLFDILVFYLLILVLRKLKYNSALIIIYWWNPILLHEIFNAGHMDLVMYPFLVGALLFYLREKYILSIVLISLAVGVKVWPIILIPFILKKVWSNKKLLVKALSVSLFIILLLFLPIIVTKLDNSLGFITYSKNWTNNESFFQIVNFLVKQFIYLFNINYHCSLCVTRWITILLFGGVIIYCLKKMDDDKNNFISISFILVAIMYLISPTQFPWYYTWALPFLVLNPRLSFVAYAILLPLYQLKYSWPYLVWIEHVPIMVLFTWELFDQKVRYLFKTDVVTTNS